MPVCSRDAKFDFMTYIQESLEITPFPGPQFSLEKKKCPSRYPLPDTIMIFPLREYSLAFLVCLVFQHSWTDLTLAGKRSK